MIKKNNKTVGFIYKNNQNIDKVYKGTDLVFEQGYTREQTGVPPITTTYQAIGKNLKDYKIYGNSIQGKLPSEYQQVEYIESTGTQYINTGISSNINIESEIDVQFTQASTASQLLMWISSSSGQWAGQINGKYGLGGGIGFDINSTTRKLVKISFSANNSTQTVNMEIDGNVISRNGAVPSATNYKIFKTDTFGSYARIYSVIIKENDVILRKYIPCYRKSDNEIGMYDLVTNTFFTNAGTGVFLKGSNAPTPTTPIEIESVGDLITDTNDINYGKYKIPVKVKSKNLFDDTTLSNKWINVSGSVVDMPKTNCKRFECVEGETYTLSASYETQHANNIIVMAFYDSNDTLIRRNVVSNLQYEELIVTAPQNSKYLYAGHYTIEPQTIQLEKSDIATEYEPYIEPVITNIYLDEPLRKIGDYSDYIDFKNSKVVRNIGKKVLDGSENWGLPTTIITNYSSYRIGNFFSTAPVEEILSTHFECFPKSYYHTNPQQNKITSYLNTSQLIIVISNSIADSNNQTSTTNFTTWLSNNNVDVYFSQDTVEETITLPNIPTIKGTTIFEIDTEIQPSSMYIKYKSK